MEVSQGKGNKDCQRFIVFHLLFPPLTYLFNQLVVGIPDPYPHYVLDPYGRCKWSTNASEPLLFVKYDCNKLNILDIEKRTPIFKNTIQTEKGKCISFPLTRH